MGVGLSAARKPQCTKNVEIAYLKWITAFYGRSRSNKRSLHYFLLM